MNRFVGVFFCLLLVPLQPIMAATLYMEPHDSTLERGAAEIISIRLDTDEAKAECVNTVEGVLELAGPLQIVDVSLGSSIFPIWVESPTISKNGKQLTFAGGIPNGYCGRIDGDPRLTNNLFDIVVRADTVAPVEPITTEAVIRFTEQTHAYLNDGFGTKTTLDALPKTVAILPTLSDGTVDPWKDEVAQDQQSPQEFSIQLTKDPLAFGGKYYITFNTSDKQTGMDRYEVIEETNSRYASFLWGRATAPWVEARSPYVLQDQTLNSIIRVKAVDKAGNEYIASLLPDEELRSVSFVQVALLSLLAVAVLMLAVGSFNFIRRRRRELEVAALDKAFGVGQYNTDTEAETSPTESTNEVVETNNENHDRHI